MGAVFLSHADEDSIVALSLAIGLEEQGFATWCFEVDSIAGVPHIEQTLKAIDESSVLLLLISPDCVHSHEVTTELTRAQDRGRVVIPALHRISYSGLMNQRGEWVQRLGSATCLQVGTEVGGAVKQVCRALEHFGVEPRESAHEISARVDLLTADLDARRLAAEHEAVLEVAPAPPRVADRAAAAAEAPGAQAATAAPPLAESPDAPRPPDKGKLLSFPGRASSVPDVCRFLLTLLANEGLETQQASEGANHMIQARKPPHEGFTKALTVGMGLEHRAVTVVLSERGPDLEVRVGAGQWSDKLVGGAIGTLVFFPTLFTAGYGAYKQQQLLKRVELEVIRYLS